MRFAGGGRNAATQRRGRIRFGPITGTAGYSPWSSSHEAMSPSEGQKWTCENGKIAGGTGRNPTQMF
jgi:hypothetical protein